MLPQWCMLGGWDTECFVKVAPRGGYVMDLITQKCIIDLYFSAPRPGHSPSPTTYTGSQWSPILL